MEKNDQLVVLGLMSGSSLDGLDIAICRFVYKQKQLLDWELLYSYSCAYTEKWVERLRLAPRLSGIELQKLDVDLATYWVSLIANQLNEHVLQKVDLIANHGHTVFHHPEHGFSTQIANNAVLSSRLNSPVAGDFRSQDIVLGGVGTPLAPLADFDLFSGYDMYLNLGGIANISCLHKGEKIGFDICACNQVLNAIAGVNGHSYDENGELARSGKLLPALLATLDNEYYQKSPPKSLDNQWCQSQVTDRVLSYPSSPEDKAHSYVHFITQKIKQSISPLVQKDRMLVTGGGAFNLYLMEKIKESLADIGVEICVPDKEIVEFKEAILMAYLGFLRWNRIPVKWSSITGARRDIILGALYETK